MAEGKLSQAVIPPAERIRELNAIDQDVAKLLAAAGQALKMISGNEISAKLNMEQKRAIFAVKYAEFTSLLSKIDVHTRRNIYALQEAGILLDEAKADLKSSTGSLGNLDVSILNSQNDRVGKEIEAEQWERARKLVDKYNGDAT